LSRNGNTNLDRPDHPSCRAGLRVELWLWGQGGVGRWPKRAVLRVDVGANLPQRLAGGRHAHDVLRDVDTDAAAIGVLVVGHRAVAGSRLDVTAQVAGMAHVAATAVARNVRQHVRVGNGEAIGVAYAWGGPVE